MKFSESWLREWVNPKISREQLGAKLTMAGLEIESIAPVADEFSGVVVGNVLTVTQHPDADRLNVCEVDVGQANPLIIVCGAANVRPAMKVAAALDGALLPRNLKIAVTAVRGVQSHGMLCSARELGLAEESEGLFALPPQAPIGKSVWEYLHLADYLFDVSITPNRGDCLSILGIAKEVSALTNTTMIMHKTPEMIASITDRIPVTIQAKAECPRYVGRIIRDVKADASTPIWLLEHLRRSGMRSISPIVDVTNFVMLELGQPMHAFDLQQIDSGIEVRHAKAGESATLLDGSETSLTPETLVIADKKHVLAIAGVMGGLASGVSLLTKDIFLESAFFTSTTIAKAGRHYKLNSESSYRFERGIDPTIQRIAVERATQLLLDIVGGKPGPIIEVSDEKLLPQPTSIHLRMARVTKMLGFTIPNEEVENTLKRLGFTCEKTAETWQVTAPPRRPDVTTEIDLIEEIGRLYGFDNIPCRAPRASLKISALPESKIPLPVIRRALIHSGYNEVITYSFVDKKFQEMFLPQSHPIEVLNPITAEMAVMRVSLWPGLVNTLLYNLNRQQTRIRIFETGLRFIQQSDAIWQQNMVAGLIYGSADPEQWGTPTRAADFFDLKGDLQNLFQLTYNSSNFTFKAGSHPALHPGQTTEIYRDNEPVGIAGALHPALTQALKIDGKAYVFELLLDGIDRAVLPQAAVVSRFPENRRDIALLVDQTVPVQALQDTIRDVAGEWLTRLELFDVYQGKGIAAGRKSVAIALTLQHSTRTLVDDEIAELMERVIGALKDKFNAELRG